VPRWRRGLDAALAPEGCHLSTGLPTELRGLALKAARRLGCSAPEMRSIPSVAATQPPIARPSRAVQPSTLVLRCAIPTPNLRILKRSGAAPTFRISAPAASFRPPIFLVRGWPWWPATAAHSELNVVALQPSVAGLNSSRRPSSSRTA